LVAEHSNDSVAAQRTFPRHTHKSTWTLYPASDGNIRPLDCCREGWFGKAHPLPSTDSATAPARKRRWIIERDDLISRQEDSI
jgi:hypothetical protein